MKGAKMFMNISHNPINKSAYAALILYFIMVMSTSNIFAADASLSWTPPVTDANGSSLTDLGGYIVYYGTRPGSYTQGIDVGNTTAYKIANLIPGTTYYFAVTAYDISGNESYYSNETSKYILNNDTSAPVISGVYANNISRTSATINWTTDEAADSQVEYGTTLSYGYRTDVDPSMVTSHNIVIGVAPSTTYYYRVLSRDASGNLSVSQSFTFTSAQQIDLTPPSISNIQITNITSSSATISWMTDEASTSQIEFGFNTSYGNKTAIDSGLVTVHSVELTGLYSYATYDLRVRSMDAGYNEALSGNHTFTTSNMPPAISAFTSNPNSAYINEVVNFSVSAFDPDGYIIKHEWDFDGDGNYDSDTGTISNAYFTYNNSGNYKAKVRITDNGGGSTVSSVQTVSIDSFYNQSPVYAYLTAEPSSGTAPLSVTFDVYMSDTNLQITKYEWDLDGNGTYEAVTTSNPISNTFSNAGFYTVKVRTTDIYGGTSTGEATVNVNNASGGKSGNGKKTGSRSK